MPPKPVNLRIFLPVYFLIRSPVQCGQGLDGQAFANANFGDKVCVAIFHDHHEAKQFAAKNGLQGASVRKCVDDQQMASTLERCKTKFGFKYAGFPTTKEDGTFNVMLIDELREAFLTP